MTLPLAQPLNLEEREVFSLKEVTSVSRENLSPSALYGVLWTEGAFLCRERAGFSISASGNTGTRVCRERRDDGHTPSPRPRHLTVGDPEVQREERPCSCRPAESQGSEPDLLGLLCPDERLCTGVGAGSTFSSLECPLSIHVVGFKSALWFPVFSLSCSWMPSSSFFAAFCIEYLFCAVAC